MDKHTHDLILAKLEAAEDELETADFLLEKQKNRPASNQLYVAANHAIQALIVSEKFESREPAEIMAFLRKKFIPAKIISMEQFEFYRHILEYKLRMEYDVTFKPETDEVANFRKEAGKLIADVKKYFSL